MKCSAKIICKTTKKVREPSFDARLKGIRTALPKAFGCFFSSFKSRGWVDSAKKKNSRLDSIKLRRGHGGRKQNLVSEKLRPSQIGSGPPVVRSSDRKLAQQICRITISSRVSRPNLHHKRSQALATGLGCLLTQFQLILCGYLNSIVPR